MVFLGPDPPSVDDLSTPNCMMPADPNEDDSDEDDDMYSGYQPLPQSSEAAENMNSSDDNEEDATPNDNIQSPDNYLPPIETVEQEVIRQVWTAPRPIENIEMNVEKEQQVIAAMASFSLPPSSIPEWAHTLSDEQWKKQLSDKIKHLHTKR